MGTVKRRQEQPDDITSAGDAHSAHRGAVFMDRDGTLIQEVPYLCDPAKVELLPGAAEAVRSLRGAGFACVVVSNRMVQCVPFNGVLLQPDGRMVRSERYKYCLYSMGKRRESLIDMKADPGEMANLAEKPRLRDVLLKHREYLREFARRHNDERALAMLQRLR